MPERLSPGLYDLLLTRELRALAERVVEDRRRAHIAPLDAEAAPEHLARFAQDLLRRALRSVDPNDAAKQAELVNRLVEFLVESAPGAGLESDDAVATPPEVLTAVVVPAPFGYADPPPSPGIPLRTSDLLVNGPRELSVGPEIIKEIASADRIDLLCSFLKWSGLRIVRDTIREFLERRPGGLRVLTTVYMGATDRRALEALVELGARVRLSYDTERTRLHAKAWLFHRDSGFSTALIGSSNLSAAALVDGLEWNVRVSAVENPSILSKFEVTFEQYWNEGEFVDYDPERDAERFDKAVSREKRDEAIQISGLEVEPRPFQREILENLEAERQHGHTRNLVVAATGTGKTVVAALDYKRERDRHGELSLLFVAHREEILKQSQRMFREVLRDGGFGELLVRGAVPTAGRHVFASIQSLHEDRLAELRSDAFDFLIVDEFHHASAPTYERLLAHLEPRILLGLTATPERADGGDVFQYFDGRIASELRLWTALDQGLLCPFQYFGVHDDTDLTGLQWTRGHYDQAQLENVYTGNDARVRIVLRELVDKVEDVSRMRALGFCVSIAHAEFMAKRFNEHGIPARAVSANTPATDRAEALRELGTGAIKVLFAVDLFNEGVDVPNVDTVLFLRPTESATVFLQQLGRGLRRAEGKECLTVLDFIGNAHRRFRFDVRYRALVGGTRQGIKEQVKQGFPSLPAGCAIRLDRESQDRVLANVQQALGQGWQGLVEDLKGLNREVSLAEFLRESGADLEDVYASGHTWTELKRRARATTEPARDGELPLAKAVSRLLHIGDRPRIEAFQAWLQQDKPPAVATAGTREHRLQMMLLALLNLADEPVSRMAETLASVWPHRAIREEIVELLAILDDRSRSVFLPLGIERLAASPLLVHGEYSRDEIFAGLGITTTNDRIAQPQAGVYYDEAQKVDIFMVTLNKTEREYSATTMYQDYPISPTLFHWESQNATRERSETGQRYINHEKMRSDVLLFVRSDKRANGRTMPYTFLGPVRYVSHERERPMQITWRLEHEMPARFFQETKIAAG
jgi:superfamily II DNA or RNA helicase/HKD family nuclease